MSLGGDTRRTARSYVLEQKNAPCTDCGVKYPFYIMDFDHRNPGEKRITISRSMCSLAKLKEELEKCDLVCANCHRERGYKRKFWLPLKRRYANREA